MDDGKPTRGSRWARKRRRPSPRPGPVDSTSPVEQQIRAAQAAGDFDELPGSGRPLENLDEVHDPAWWARNLARREGVSMLPPALEVRRDLEKLLQELPVLRSERIVRERVAALDARIARVNTTTTAGPPTSLPRLDVEALVARWRDARGD